MPEPCWLRWSPLCKRASWTWSMRIPGRPSSARFQWAAKRSAGSRGSKLTSRRTSCAPSGKCYRDYRRRYEHPHGPNSTDHRPRIRLLHVRAPALDLDAVSHPISFFDVLLAVGKHLVDEPTLAKVRASWRKGMKFMLDRQTADGGWYDPEFHPTGVEITAHLIQDSIVADLLLGDEFNVRECCRKGVMKLLSVQAADGSWDGENVDHTMDCTRSIMLVCSVLGMRAQCDRAIERGLEWILKHKCEHGWPDFPGMETNLERTCDGLDTLLKYRAYSQPVTTAIVKLWGYAA